MICGGNQTLKPPEVDVMTRRFLVSLAGLVLAAGLAGCSQGGGAQPSPTLTPSTPAAVTPLASPTPDMDALYAEAEWVVRRANELEEQAIREGTYPAELEELLADPYLSWSQAGIPQFWELGWKQAPGESAQLTVRPQPDVRVDDSEAALEGCLLRTSTVDAAGSTVAPQRLVLKTYFFKQVDGRLKLFTSTTGTEIEQCPFE